MRKGFILLASILILVAGFTTGCKDKKVEYRTLKLAHSLEVTHPVHKGLVVFANTVKRESKGKLQIDIYPSGQFGSESECLELVQFGAIDMTKISSATLENFSPAYKVLSIPYLFTNREDYWKMLDGPAGQMILESGIPKKLKGLCYYDAGARSFYFTDRTINTPKDLKGSTIRVMNSVTATKMVESFGASAKSVSWGELYTALQQGVVNGAENNPPSFLSSNHYELCKKGCYTLDEHTRPADVLVINPSVWDSLDNKLKEIINNAIKKSVEVQKKLWIDAEAADIAKAKTAGVKIVYPDKALFQEATKGLREQMMNDPMLTDIISTMKESN